MSDLVTTRLSLHAVAELLLAGPQFQQSRTIKLRATPGGFGTVAEPDARIEGNRLRLGTAAAVLADCTVADVAGRVGLTPRPLDDLYSGGCGLTEEHALEVEETCAGQIADCFRDGAAALAAFAPEAERVLWPEHFDLAISLGEVNYGVSPGDDHLAVPYAYVGPWTPADFSGPFWNTPFGAARPLSEIDDLVGFFAEGRDLTSVRDR